MARARKSEQRLFQFQFQCDKEGSLFYFQTISAQTANVVVHRCPLCGTTRISTTGRKYTGVNETKKIKP